MKLKKIAFGALASASMIGSAFVPALAASLISNGSFESGIDPGVFAIKGVGSTDIDNWSVDAGTVDYIGSYWTASDGSRSIDMSGNNAGTISQEVTTTPGAVYTLSFDMSGNPAGGPAVKSMDVSVAGETETYSYDVLAEGNTLADMLWQPNSLNFTATGTTETVQFISTTNSAFGPALDNVSIEQYLPQTKDDCKKDGWMSYGVFKNQGDCVSYVATGGTNQPALE